MKIPYETAPEIRVKLEIENTQDKQLKIIGEYLLDKFKSDLPLALAYQERKITLDKIFDYVRAQAQAQAQNGCAMVEDNEVFGWVLHYVQDEKIKITEDTDLTLGEEKAKAETPKTTKTKAEKPKTETKKQAEPKEKKKVDTDLYEQLLLDL